MYDKTHLAAIFEEDVERLAFAIQRRSKRELTHLAAAVTSLTRAVQATSVDELTVVTRGDWRAARDLKETVTFWGVMIKYTLARTIPPMDEAHHLAHQVNDFVAAVLTIADHLS